MKVTSKEIRKHEVKMPVRKRQLKRVSHDRKKIQPKSIQATQISLGFERAHPLVWEYMRKKGILVIGYNTVWCPNRPGFLREGQRVITCVPKSQGGTGIVGIGKVTGPAKMFMKGGQPLPDAVGSQYMAEMRKIYSDSCNKPAKAARCWKKQFKNHHDRNEERGGAWDMTCWDYAQRVGWGPEITWSKWKHDPNAAFVHVSVQWERTAHFDNGVSKMDWSSLGLPDFRLASIQSVTPRPLSKAHWAAIRTQLGKAPKPAQAYKRNSTKPTKPNSARVLTQKSSKPSGVPKPSLARVSKPNSVDALLASLDLSKYAAKLQAEEVIDVATLKLLTDADLEALGFPLGPRRKLQAILVNMGR
eukprot:gnl/MRDRNA2_/MRDRNA2_92176_c0_seq1.p1 gnl/MRDRNA2_/MRDRNA2_92176_c0~~gnl/MRDRNA2_/MRDRNA2_92176_c0_seq1.p1  ORF type:complete len:359 (+),score=53.11 gnl/MRDRNA2_/MRDRNA2_92176_c0_seq1:82-1158(+)